jgi:DtxR family Mn-dependent transcriptional regulator
MYSPVVNLLIFAAVVAAAILLFLPRFGLIENFRRRRRRSERVYLEDTLKYIYVHEYHNETATLAGVTDALRISSTKSLALVERMQVAGLVSVLDGRILLAERGRKYALQVIRAHRLWERYLADETGVDPKQWHARAERHEHALTPEQADALSRRLGNPRFDPHGDPIPTSDGELPDEKIMSLTQLRAGDNARVVHIEDKPEAVFAQLAALGVYLGMELRVAAKTDERILIDTEGGRRLVLAPIVAGNVSIQRMTEQEREVLERAHETLSRLNAGEAADVVRISPACRGLERRRLMDLGILPGTRVEYERRGLTGGLTSYRLRDTVIALRREQAEMISIHNRGKVAS